MIEQSVPVRSWIRRDLGDRFGGVLREDVPKEMLELLDVCDGQD